MKRSILVVDDDPNMREMVQELLEAQSFEVATAPCAEDAIELARERSFDAALTDLQMPEMDGLGLLGSLRELHPELPVILMTSFGSIQTAVAAMQAGAHDYVTKPFETESLLLTIERALEKRDLQEENRRLRAAVDRTACFGDLVGKSGAMNEIYALIRKISSTRSNVLITGESGTGKEVVARTIHFTGNRADKPFVPINCTAMPEGLLESELFGHARGAFTGAHASKKGLFEVADGGTLFLDEIGDMPASLQGKLLRVLQDQEVRPVGANHSVKVDVRLIAATNCNLKEEIQKGNFREDLYYRLNVIPIHIPPLRERPDDIPALANAFLARLSGDVPRHLSERAMQKLQRAPWPGNARELENCIERSLALAEGTEVRAGDVLIADDPLRVEGSLENTILQLAQEQRLTLHALNELYVDAVLEATHGRKSEAARILGVNRRTLYRREERRAQEQAKAS
ncbi:MAG: sigma-54-dependent Fis family transcriptional regulator [Deltaproteobacteria bacterium]|jgi:DNA-binding NtrC family response regulator|nr:sigma-54-dependent Fis family transcriptional regulator [Deltaproteobacteria bacterium]